MKLKNIFFIFSIIMLLFGIFYLISLYMVQQPMNPFYTKISVIVRESSSDAIVNLQQGLEQAAADMDVEMSLVTLTEQNSAEQQKKMIEREVNSGAEAIIITPIENEELKQCIEKVSEQIPIIFMGNSLQNSTVSISVLGQDEEMGKELGKKIFVKGIFNKTILLLESSQQCNSINKRKEGILSVIEKRAKSITKQPFEITDDAIKNLEQMIQNEEPDIIIALEPTILDMTAEAVQHLQKDNIAVYGFGMTTKTPSYIEKDDITAAMIQNDFNLGYLSIHSAMETLHKVEKREKGKIDYAFVNEYNMYTKENQRLLFPFLR